jgi:hypothetical protein
MMETIGLGGYLESPPPAIVSIVEKCEKVCKIISMSRADARGVLAYVGHCKHIQLDFSEVPEIGQAFADEIFRVFTLAHPTIKLEAVNANPDVQRMIKRVQQTKVQGI